MSWNFDLASIFDSISDRFFIWRWSVYLFNDRYRDHWLIGIIVEHVTDSMEGYLFDLGIGFDDLEDRTRDIYDVLNATFKSWLSGDALERYIWQLNDFRDNPFQWIITQMCEILPGFDLFCLDPGYHIMTWLCGRWPGVCDLFSDPVCWVISRISEHWPDFYWLVQDPSWTIRSWLVDAWPWLDDLFEHPKRWIVNQLSDIIPGFDLFCLDPGYQVGIWLTQRFPELYEFLLHPAHWVVVKFLEVFPYWSEAFYNPGQWFLESLAWALDCDVAELRKVWAEITEFVDHPGEYIAEVLIEFLGNILENWITTYWNRELP